MKKIEQFINQYSLSKTLRFKLIPQGKTLEHFESDQVLFEDETRSNEYVLIKKLMDEYHKQFIERILGEFKFDCDKLQEYADLYVKSGCTSEEIKRRDELVKEFRKSVSKTFTDDEVYPGLFGADIIREFLPGLPGLSDEQREALLHFASFTTYFTGFYDNRKNLYTGDGKVTEIAYRIVDQNLPKFLDNIRDGRRAMDALSESTKYELNTTIGTQLSCSVDEIFSIEYFNRFLCQSGIDIYNQMIGGYTGDDGTKVQGINEKINLYNQQNGTNLPKLRPLFKQILSDRSSISYLPDSFTDDKELLTAVQQFASEAKESIEELANIFRRIDEYDTDHVYITAGKSVNALSQGAFGSWSVIQRGLEDQYDAANRVRPPKNEDNYLKTRKRKLGVVKSRSLQFLQKAAVASGEELNGKTLVEYIRETAKNLADNFSDALDKTDDLFRIKYTGTLIADDDAIERIKNLLDAMKDFYRFAEMFLGSGKEADKDGEFYGEFSSLIESLDPLTPLYNMVRNYVTRKPYSDTKIKLNFNNSQLLGGWDENKEKDYCTVLLRKDGKYYLAVMNKEFNKSFEEYPPASDQNDAYEKMIYKLLPGPNKMLPKVFFSKKRMAEFGATEALYKKYKEEKHLQGPNFDLTFCHELIDFFKESISKHPDWKQFGFKFKDTDQYQNIPEFYNEVSNQGYKVTFVRIPVSYVDELVDEGKLYLFQIYNKDMSECSRGTPNLHTLYFRMLFDQQNMDDLHFTLNGGAEIFYRKASLECKETHPALQDLENKNPKNPKKHSKFTYPLYKDKRYMEDQFTLHLPITLNFTAPDLTGKEVRLRVRKALRDCDDNYVIGIDRGERNLLYICVIDGSGRIVEQRSLNSIINSYNGVTYETDYHGLLDEKEKKRDAARKSWKTIEPIRELKEGYISQVIHYLCGLVEKYDAVIALESLSNGFKSSRGKFEKQIYQKFEKMLIDKLSFMVDKRKRPNEAGGLLNAYQLTSTFESFEKMGYQNGFLFYIPAWLTSKIDPTTGFVDLLHPRYQSKEVARDFIRCFDRICKSDETGLYEFLLDYDKFPNGSKDYRKRWKLESYGTRIKTYRDQTSNNQWGSIEIDLTMSFDALFDRYHIDTSVSDLREILIKVEDAEFYKEFIKLLGLLLQMRNSVTGTDVDYLISPIRNSTGDFYDSRKFTGDNAELPVDADANGAYHIARKAQWAIQRIKDCDEADIEKISIAISNKQWLEYVQKDNL